eukprot:3933357-Rhodomonas_salina.3
MRRDCVSESDNELRHTAPTRFLPNTHTDAQNPALALTLAIRDAHKASDGSKVFVGWTLHTANVICTAESLKTRYQSCRAFYQKCANGTKTLRRVHLSELGVHPSAIRALVQICIDGEGWYTTTHEATSAPDY